MVFIALIEDWENLTLGTAALLSVIAIVLVFFILALLIFVCSLFQKGMEVVDAKTSIQPKPENAILSEDNDAVVAVLAATIDFHKETGKEPEVISVSRIED